ncbi:MAG: hypothetical protein U0271_19575 [Polyangiaceae bacterium]
MSVSLLKAALVSLGIASLAPAYALADSAGGTTVAEQREAKFPMEGATFKQRVEARFQHFKSRVERALERRNVPEDKQKEIMKDVEAAHARVTAAAENAAKDGTVTKEEAKDVRAVAKSAKAELKEKYGIGKGGHGKAKGKGKGKRKAQSAD